MNVRQVIMRMTAVAAVVLAGGLLCGCGAELPPGGRSTPSDFQIAEEVQVVDASEVSDVDPDGLVLRAASADDVPKVGDILVSDVEPTGFLRRVTAVGDLRSGTVAVVTEQASLAEAVEQGNVQGHIALSPQGRLARTAAGHVPQDLSSSVVWELPDGAGQASLEVSFDPDLSFDPEIHFDWGIDYLKLPFTGSIDASITGQVALSKAVTKSYTKSLGSVPLGKAVIMAGPVPIYFSINLDLVAGLELSASAEGTFDVGGEARAEMTVGAEYRNRRWSPINTRDITFDFIEPAVTLGGSAQAEAYVRGQLEIHVYEFLGPYVECGPYAQFLAEADLCQLDASLGLGVSAHAGGEVEIFDHSLASFNLELFDYGPIELWSDSLVFGGPVAATATADQATIEPGQSTTLRGSATGGCVPYTYHWTAPGGWSSSLRNPTVSPSSTMIYTLTVTDSASPPQTDTDTVTITVNPPGNDPPEITHPSASGSLTEGQEGTVTVSCTATDTDGTVVSVTANLSQIGGSPTQALANTTGNTWQWSGPVTPPSSGSKTITFTATDDDGAADTDQADIYVSPQSAPPDMVFVPAGEFQMGDPWDEGYTDERERPVHSVYLSPYHIDTWEVTNQQYADGLNWAWSQGGLITVTGGVVYQYGSGTTYRYCSTYATDSDSRITWDGDTFSVVAEKENHPMVEVSWYGAVAYCNWRSAIEGKPLCYDLSTWSCNFGVAGYRLPTEAEWEKAAGWDPVQQRHFRFGEHTDGCGTSCLDPHRANYAGSSDPYEAGNWWTTPVGFYNGALHYKADFGWPGSQTSYQTQNAHSYYGCYDMSGNVGEWCHDWYSSTYYSTSPSSNPTGPGTGARRVLRGGYMAEAPYLCRSANRESAEPLIMDTRRGFRCVVGTP
ncbi:MAG TPA: SUMF1/EgtB/PvdO family nonheme iron enzyme [Phycisphaerae bacterium]|nr:SUMF1/EgtB/PvdO family nonheme iron enzyme [Phycisphaerae bacterium]